ncbi:MAG: hypothetical protein ACREVL_19400 [Solimonas sp.]
MEVLPFVSFILWTTGLFTVTLIGLAVRDWYSERALVAARNRSSAHPQSITSDCSVASVGVEARSLLKAA